MISKSDNVYIMPQTTNILYKILSTDNKKLPRLKFFKRMLTPTIANTPLGSAEQTSDKYEWYLYLTAMAIVKSIN